MRVKRREQREKRDSFERESKGREHTDRPERDRKQTKSEYIERIRNVKYTEKELREITQRGTEAGNRKTENRGRTKITER